MSLIMRGLWKNLPNAGPSLLTFSTTRASDGDQSTTVSSDATTTNKSRDWRKQQLDNLEKRFVPKDDSKAAAASSSSLDNADSLVQDDEDLQPMWRDMESRVKNRRSRTLAQNNGKIGRRNVRKTDEDVWLEEGLYDNDNSRDPKKN